MEFYTIEYDIRGVIWSQGETDAVRLENEISKETYFEYLSNVMNYWKEKTEHIYMIQTGTKLPLEPAGYGIIREYQNEFCSNNDFVHMSYNETYLFGGGGVGYNRMEFTILKMVMMI